MVSDADIAWAAGLFEGEGCIGIWLPPSARDHLKHPQTKLSVLMTDKDVVDEFCRIVECGKVSQEQARKPPRKNCWYWTIGNRDDVERILTMFLPRLGSRRRGKALEALAEIAQRRAELFRTCVRCGVTFEAKREFARFCSTACQQSDYYSKHGNVRVAERAVA